MQKRIVFHLGEESQKMVESACKQILEQMGESTKNPFSETERERAIYEANTEIKRLKEQAVKLTEECESAKREVERLTEENASAVDFIEKQTAAKIRLEENLRNMADLKNKYKDCNDQALKKIHELEEKLKETEERLTEAVQNIGRAYLDGKKDAKAVDVAPKW